MLRSERAARAGLDGLALKPAEVDVRAAPPADVLAVDYEGHGHVPDPSDLAALTDRATVYVTTPVRADGYDPLGDDALLEDLPAGVGRVLVAGNGAYLDDREKGRAIAPRIEAALDAYPDDAPAPWVGTEGIERLALAAGGVQYDLLSRSTAAEARALRRVGYDGDLAVYAPTVLSDDDDAVLDALGGYVSRRAPVRSALPDGAATDASATGRAREVLLSAARDYALVGAPDVVADRVDTLRDAGVDYVVGYPATGLDPFQ